MPSIAVARPLVVSPDVRPRVRGLTRVHAALVACLFATALVTRAPALDATGLSEDEMDKLAGAHAYAQGTFVVDGEHPALLKLAVLASLQVRSTWNAVATSHGATPMSLESAVRMPNAIAGALIAVVLTLLVGQFFGPVAALAAGWLWAVNINAIAINRIAKEDSFALLGLLTAAWLFERGKTVGATDPRRAQRWFAAAGAAFGLMLASKYVPYLFGIHVVYFRLADPNPGPNRIDKRIYLGALAAAFAIGNFPLLAPGNWLTIAHFVSERAIQHSGYFFQGKIWPNAMSATPSGIPVWFYAAAIVTKTPLAILALSGVGLWQIGRRWRERGSLFVLTILVLTFVPYSLVATKFLRYLLPSLAMLDIAAAVGTAWLIAAIGRHPVPLVRVAGAGALAIALFIPVQAWRDSHPYSRLYRNALGHALSPGVLWFPPDELYDAGLREAVAELALRAGHADRVVTEAPKTTSFYAALLGRDDLRVVRPEELRGERADWLVVQDGHLYYENIATVERARQRPPAFEVDVNGYRAVEVYRASGGD